MTTTNYEKLNCPIAKSLSVLGDQWTFLIVRDALSGTTRFNEFQDSLGISRNLLSKRMQQLCDAGLLERLPIANSKRFEYLATDKCRELRPVVLSLAAWGTRWFNDDKLGRVDCINTETGNPVEVGFVDAGTKRQVDPSTVKSRRRPVA